MRKTLILLALAPTALFAQSFPPGKPQAVPVVVEGGAVHVGNGQVYTPGYVVFSGGKIAAVGQGAAPAAAVPTGALRVSASGKHVYPGLIVTNNVLGLDEVGAVRATHDYAEVGAITPEVQATTAYNAASEVTPTVRANGILTAMVCPSGVWMPGRPGLVQLDAWTADDATLKRSLGVSVLIPNRFNNSGWWAEPGSAQPNENRPAEYARIREVLRDGKSYAQAPKGSRPANERLEALRNVFAGTERLFIYAYGPREVKEGVLLAREYGITKPVIITDASSAVAVADFLAQEKVPVILNRIHSLPSRGDSPYDEAYAAPGKLRTAGVDFALDISGDMEPMQARNLGLMAGTAQGYGLTEEQALEAVTLAPARIIGTADRLGSLEAGKDATLFISEGPFSDIRTGKLVSAYIGGRAVTLDTRQKALYRHYAARYGLKTVE